MFDSLMCRLLDGSRRAKQCAWKRTGIKYIVTGPRSYQLAEDWWCESGITGNAAVYELGGHVLGTLSQDGRLILSAGFVWDGPSGPTYDPPDSMAGSAAHDLLYRLGRMHKLGPDKRDEADGLALKIWLQDGMYVWRARLWYKALRRFAGYAYSGKPEDIVTVGK